MYVVIGVCIYKKIILKNVYVVCIIFGMYDLLKFLMGKIW